MPSADEEDISMMSRTALRWILVLAAGALGTATASAQTDVEINAAVQFNFASPGARSLALGGAFVGLADDATAAFTNPAGLTTLSKPEVSVEGRGFEYSHLFTRGGRLGGTPTGLGVDNASGLVSGESEDSVTGLSFASIVYPRGNFAIAAYRHEVANFEANIETEGAFFETSRVRPVRADMQLDIVNYGISASYRFGENASLGAGVSFYDFAIDSRTRRFQLTGSGTGSGGFYGPPLFTDANAINTQLQTGDDTAIAFNFGASVKAGEKVRIGGVFRKGPEFEFTASNAIRIGNEDFVFVRGPATFRVPDAFGAGISYRATDSLTVAIDFQRVMYSQLTDEFVSVFPDLNALPANPVAPVAKRGYVADDSSEVHVGIEYVFAGMANPLAVRVGAWNDPDHRIRFTGAADDPDRALFRAGDDEIHVSGGLGMVFGGSFQIDAAVDASSRVTQVAVSAVLRF
jgi:long-subunit fatty acid transport protein